MLDSSFSLSLALQSAAKERGLELDVDDVHAVLGLSMMVCAAPMEPDPSLWHMYARNAFVAAASSVFGITVRDLHPPDVARGLGNTAEFRQHFDASYRPLILRALEHDQPVLAWQGWPGLLRLHWGVITEPSDGEAGFGGLVFGNESVGAQNASAQELVGPPVQLYVVEAVAPREPRDDELLRMVIDHARCQMRAERCTEFGVLMGIAAWDSWIQTVKRLARSGAYRPGQDRGFNQLALTISASHRSGMRFFDHQKARLGNSYQPLLASLSAGCAQVVTLLEHWANLNVLKSALMVPEGRKRLLDELVRARLATVDLFGVLETSAKTLDSQ